MADRSSLEKPMCWGWMEELLFDEWRDLANSGGRPNKAAAGIIFEDQVVTGADGAHLRGYRAFSASVTAPDEQPAVLVAPGNAMLADQLYTVVAFFADRGRTSYVFDYRGYGDSDGSPYSTAIIEDYKRLLAFIRNVGHPRIAVYAMSFGGIVTLAALDDDAIRIDALVLDGVPSELPWIAMCPESLDPINNIGAAPEPTLVLSGSADPIVTPEQSSELRAAALKRHMQVQVLPGFSHPGLDESPRAEERLDIVFRFLN
ncbi:alpha/beta hydrolase [Dongia deserti]|uniref:alpha/beta hydrolase n=1 Tax=Dongia deserti TaxID=2268030 RepID=UPI0013C511D1|nr:alpha/beta hydrolase [Dongia deserti]